MKLFSRTFANWSCPGCNRTVALVSPNLHLFFLGATFSAALAFQVGQLSKPDGLRWYYFPCIWAAELLILFVTGMLLSPLIAYLQRAPEKCPSCGGTLFFCGQYFEKFNKAHWTDRLLVAAFIVANGVLWWQW